ncbi:MAG: AzlC family ABC transporter permease [Spirochaetaceae bacterium]|nr:AzlC family ABC transporter permease [Spirochaetaceae bacterium]
MPRVSEKRGIFFRALSYSFPVFLGYISIGFGFGLLLSGAGYPWWLSALMGIVMYAGAGQYFAVALFAGGASLPEACLFQLVLNARHLAYGLSMIKRFRGLGLSRFYLMYALTDETFALYSGLKDEKPGILLPLALLNQAYWVFGSLIGSIAGALIPFDMGGVEFALTALFIVLMIEQYLTVKKIKPFILTAIIAVLGTFFLPSRISLLGSLALSLGLAQFFLPARGEGDVEDAGENGMPRNKGNQC